MARGQPGRGSDQFPLRLPDGMRDRIKAAAEANNRSMNAEILATLEEAYPPSRRFRFPGLDTRALQWHSGSWHLIDYNSWMKFRTGEIPREISDHMTEGNNYFAVIVLDEDETLQNIITHNYAYRNGQCYSAPFELLSESERREYATIEASTNISKEEQKRLKDLREKIEPAFALPDDALNNLRRIFSDSTPENELNSILSRIS